MQLLSVVQSLILSINETELNIVKVKGCNTSCIRQTLVKLLRHSGFDAAVCVSKWQGSGKVPGGINISLNFLSIYLSFFVSILQCVVKPNKLLLLVFKVNTNILMSSWK